MFVVYAIYNEKHNKIYIGQTHDLEKRLFEHNNHVLKGYTSRYDGVWILIYHEIHKNRSLAIKRESQLKSYKGRQFIKSHIPR